MRRIVSVQEAPGCAVLTSTSASRRWWFWRFWPRSILLGQNRVNSVGAVGLLLPPSRPEFGQVDEIDLAVFSIADVGERSRTLAVTELPWRGLWGAGGVLRQPSKPAQVSRRYRGLPG